MSDATMQAKLVLALFAACTIACVAASGEVNQLDEELLSSPERSHLYFFRDSSGRGRASLKAHNVPWEPAEGADHTLIEVQSGPHLRHHQARLADMGLELIQVQEGLGDFHAEGYSDLQQLHDKLKAIETANPSFAKLINLSTSTGIGKTKGGREIFALKLSDNVETDEDEPNAMMVSAHHSRELVTPEVALDAAQKLAQKYAAGDSDVKNIIDNWQVYIICTMNPDGVNAVWNGNSWQRANNNGVDLNRNYPIGWAPGHPSGYHGSCHGDGYAGSETYRGPSPLSEVETKTMDAFQKDRKFAKVMDVHSYARGLRINYGCHPLPSAVHAHQAKLGAQVASKMNYPQGQSCCMGGDIHYSYAVHGALAFLTELGGDAFQPQSSTRQAVVDETWPGWLEFFKLPVSAQGHIYSGTASNPGSPVQAKLTLSSVPCSDANCVTGFTLGEQTETSAQGRYHLWLPQGSYQVTVTPNDGSTAKTVTISTSDAGSVQDVYLTESTVTAVAGVDAKTETCVGLACGGDKRVVQDDTVDGLKNRPKPDFNQQSVVAATEQVLQQQGTNEADMHQHGLSPLDIAPQAEMKGMGGVSAMGNAGFAEMVGGGNPVNHGE